MRQGIRRDSPAMVVALLALFVALSGGVYAAKKARIDGRAIRAKSIPASRLKPHSIGADRLRPGLLRDSSFPTGQLTGADINELTLGQVPNATHADTADTARSAVDAQTALNAVNAIDAQTVNGHGVGCMPETQPFAGACWESSAHEPVDAPTAARKCAARGGALPEALELAAFAELDGVNLAPEDEWSSDIVSLSGKNVYSVGTVSSAGVVSSGLFKTGGPSDIFAYRCVIPLVS